MVATVEVSTMNSNRPLTCSIKFRLSSWKTVAWKRWFPSLINHAHIKRSTRDMTQMCNDDVRDMLASPYHPCL